MARRVGWCRTVWVIGADLADALTQGDVTRAEALRGVLRGAAPHPDLADMAIADAEHQAVRRRAYRR
jgi:hypothetical protein